MPQARCIVCERSPKWAVALRGPLQEAGVRVYETRTLDDCWQESGPCPASIVGLEATPANLVELVAWMKRFAAVYPRGRVIVMGQRGMESGQWLLREAGAVHVVFSPRNWQPVVRIIRRHLAAHSGAERSDRERFWQRIPWPQAAGDQRTANGT
jgi:hypothetical protein